MYWYFSGIQMMLKIDALNIKTFFPGLKRFYICFSAKTLVCSWILSEKIEGLNNTTNRKRFDGDTEGGSWASLCVSNHRWPFSLLRTASISESFNLASRCTPLSSITEPSFSRVSHADWLAVCCVILQLSRWAVTSATAPGLMGSHR